jgi:tetratricopeptide (TPR) repeat protein
LTRSAQQLRDEIALREASLADVRRELALGELSSSEAASIEARELTALDTARRELGELATEVPQRPSTRKRRRWMLLVALVCFFVAASLLLWSSLSPRQPGNSITGSVSLGRAQHVTQLLSEAEADIANGNVDAALSAYQQVLILSPKNVPALTQSGWLDFSAGSSGVNAELVKLGVKDLREAIDYAPRNPAPRLYYAIVADSTPDNRALAKSQFQVFLALKPSPGQLAIARPFLKQLGLATS